MLPSVHKHGVGTPESLISRLDLRPTPTPVQRFAAPLRDANAWLGAIVNRYIFDVGLFHPHLHAGVSRRFRLSRRFRQTTSIASTAPHSAEPPSTNPSCLLRSRSQHLSHSTAFRNRFLHRPPSAFVTHGIARSCAHLPALLLIRVAPVPSHAPAPAIGNPIRCGRGSSGPSWLSNARKMRHDVGSASAASGPCAATKYLRL